MYLILTERCNMTCRHCCMSAGPEGRDMPEDVFRAALTLANEYEDHLTAGGGEPTLHPQFWSFLGQMVLWSPVPGECPVCVITNGSQTATALQLAKLRRAGVVHAELSQDVFHDPIDVSVVQAFTAIPHAVRSVPSVARQGRGADEGVADWSGLPQHDYCSCPDLIVNPDGTLWACGCRTQQYGTVFDPDIPNDYVRGDCAGIEQTVTA